MRCFADASTLVARCQKLLRFFLILARANEPEHGSENDLHGFAVNGMVVIMPLFPDCRLTFSAPSFSVDLPQVFAPHIIGNFPCNAFLVAKLEKQILVSQV